MSDPVSFTYAAAKKVWELIQDDGNLDLKLRVYVTGGGCSGFQYGFAFEEEVAIDDTVIARELTDLSENAEVKLLIDPLSFQYLSGAEIDYQENIEGDQFIIRNPNAKTTCGCGSSFTTE